MICQDNFIKTKFKHSLTGHTSGKRNGKQAFITTNFRTNETFGNYNFTPSGRFTYAVTQLSDFTDFLSNVKAGTNTTYDDEIFESGEISAGMIHLFKEAVLRFSSLLINAGLFCGDPRKTVTIQIPDPENKGETKPLEITETAFGELVASLG